jgi:hypothetical protein
MKLQRALICIVGVFIAVGFVTTQTSAGGDPPGCTDSEGNLMQIEISALRSGGKAITSGPGKETGVTSKARILKGTAVSGTTLDTTLTIEALDGTTVISSSSTGPIRLGVGKGGKGAKLSVAIPQCITGFVNFVATFSGFDEGNDVCENFKALRKPCS